MASNTAQVLVVAGMILAPSGGRLLAATPPEAFARQTVPEHLRILDCRMAALVTNGMARSSTLRQLTDTVGTLRGIVYVKTGYYVNPDTKRVLSGALSHRISVAGAYRLLHLMVAPESGDRPLVILAHELQHAIEVLEHSDVATEAAVDRLFDRIGTHTGAGVVETQAAQVAERAVARELSANRGSAHAPIVPHSVRPTRDEDGNVTTGRAPCAMR